MGPHWCNIACIGNLISSIKSVTPAEINVLMFEFEEFSQHIFSAVQNSQSYIQPAVTICPIPSTHICRIQLNVRGMYTQRNLFRIILNQPEIRLYLIRFLRVYNFFFLVIYWWRLKVQNELIWSLGGERLHTS